MATDRRHPPERWAESPARLGVVVLYAVGALLAAVLLLTAMMMPNWLATPIVAITMLGGGLALILLGGRRRPTGHARRQPGKRPGQLPQRRRA